MGATIEFVLLCLCWLGALATLFIFLEAWFALSRRNRFLAHRASGAYGVISVLVPLRGSAEKLERTILSVFNQSYPFIELFLIYPEQNRALSGLAGKFRSFRSHIPVRLVETNFPIESQYDCARALERAVENARGRWLVTFDSGIILDRLAIETALELAGSNDISALALRPGVRCRTFLEKLTVPAREHFVQVMRTARRARHERKGAEADLSFLLVNRETFEVVNRINRMPGILNEAGWNVWSYQIEGLRTFEADGSQWIWRDVDFGQEPPSPGYVAASIGLAFIAVAGVFYVLMLGLDNFARASILAFSGISYSLTAAGYFLFARRLHAAAWAAPVWFMPHLMAAALAAFHPLERPLGNPRVTQVIEIVKDGKSRGDTDKG